MSHYICRSLMIDEKEGKVYMTGTDNNVWAVNPRTGREYRDYRRSEFPFFSRALQEEGRDRVEEYLAIDALEGNIKFQSGKFLDFTKWYWARVEEDAVLRDKTSWRHHDYDGDADTERQWKEEREKLLIEQWRQFLATRKAKAALK